MLKAGDKNGNYNEYPKFNREKILKNHKAKYVDNPRYFDQINGFENEFDWENWTCKKVWEYS